MPRSPCRVDEQTPLSTGTVPPPAAGRAAAGHGRGGPGGGDALAGDLLPAGGAAGDRAAHVRVRADPPPEAAPCRWTAVSAHPRDTDRGDDAGVDSGVAAAGDPTVDETPQARALVASPQDTPTRR